MEDNSSGDDEIQDSPLSPKSGGKKVKLNDGSSQDSFKATVPETKDENMDSGVSADKSESTSSDGAGTSKEPSNELVIAAPSTSNVRAILLNIKRPKRSRNYRKRNRDSESNDSSKDSGDPSGDENPRSSREQNTNDTDTDTEIDEYHRLIDLCSSQSGESSNNGTSSETCDDSDDMIQMRSYDTSSEDEEENAIRDDGDTEDDDDKMTPPSVLLKERPKHNYVILKEVINREMGLTFPCGKATKNDVIFEQKFYSSLHAVYRMKKLHSLNKHRGCVNSINFHPEGRLLASGSDDTNVVVWDWAKKVPLQTIKTGHKSNVFQSKFLYLNSSSQLNIVTCARDGQVRLVQCGSSGGSWSRRRVAAHARAAHKLHVTPLEPHSLLSAGEDGLVLHCDLREEHANRLLHVKERGATVPLYSVHGHPLDARELVVAGRDKFVRVFDRRRAAAPLALYCPALFTDDTSNTKKKMRISMMHLTCAMYNHDGTEILGSYNDDDIYLFDTKNDLYTKDTNRMPGYTHHYTGHRNSATFKGVSYFGPKSEYIVSGSDCSHIYFWEKKTESIVQWLQGDVNGVVNCIEPHPRFPVLATSGLDKDVKIWTPHNFKDPTYNKLLKQVIRDNNASQLHSPLFNDFLPTLYSAWRGENRLFSDDDDLPYSGNIEFDGNICTTF